jgi:GGDEF domain-containing protein
VLSNIEYIDQVRAGAQKILDAISESVKVDGDEIMLSGSIGIAVYPFDGEATERLIRNADAAMYMAKGCGKNNYRFFTGTGLVEGGEQMGSLRNVRCNDNLVCVYHAG